VEEKQIKIHTSLRKTTLKLEGDGWCCYWWGSAVVWLV